MITRAWIRRGAYFDSITLMKVARSLLELEGVEDASALMATPANLEMLAEGGLAAFAGETGEREPTSEDVLVVVRASDERLAEEALEAARGLLLGGEQAAHSGRVQGDEMPTTTLPRSLEEARARLPEAGLAVISVPGMYAVLEAAQALRAGLHVFLFSDNVSREDEIALKGLGEERDLLVMGPDCGTARLDGIGLGFVNVVPDGPIGLVGASGTGMQQVMCLLAEAGYGIAQAIGCGSRDLTEEVGGVTTLRGLHLLQEDEETRVIVLISKPPARAVAERVLEAARRSKKPVVVDFVGAQVADWQGRYGPSVYFARTLDEAARLAGALYASGQALPEPDTRASSTFLRNGPPYLAALFSGGTLCEEALHLWGEQIGPLYSNLAHREEWSLDKKPKGSGHYALDLGADEYTLGRPHPMIDSAARLKYFYEAASNAEIGVILLDIVLGYCAHADPAAIYAPALQAAFEQARAEGRTLSCVISLCGTEGDPQQLSRQAASLRKAGAEVYTSNARAALRCLELVSQH